MSWIALRMLTGDYVKYLGMIFGVAFSTLLIAQQSSVFLGLVDRAATSVHDVRDADIWVMDPRIEAVDSAWALPDSALERVRGIAGVKWAAPFLKASTTLVGPDLPLQTATLFGLDDASLAGLPPKILAGSREALRAPGAVFIDEGGWRFLFPGQPFTPGRTLELNDNRAVIVGMVDAGVQFSSQVSLYSRYAYALNFAPGGRNRMTFVIAKAENGLTAEAVARRIELATQLKALSSQQFARSSSRYIIGNTGIPISFGVVVALGVVVGIVVVALTFSLFIRDNLKQFGTLKAIGVSNAKLIGMVALQGILVGVIGYAIGIGAATTLVFKGAEESLALRGFFVPASVAWIAAAIVAMIIGVAGAAAMRRVLTTDPADVFRA